MLFTQYLAKEEVFSSFTSKHTTKLTIYIISVIERKRTSFFDTGKSISELHRRKDWKKSPFLRNLIEGPLKQKVNQMKKGGI